MSGPTFIGLGTLSTKKCVFNCLIRRWDTLSTKKGCLIAWICNSGSTKKGVINCLNCRGGIAPRKVYLIAQIADGEGQHSCGGSVKLVQNTVDDAKSTQLGCSPLALM
ncbi:hypothetical protein KY285_002922 [Solanum tuberosum]|nr:hypothetical protein KY285_002922 [Solanum tuberosum]